MELNSIWAACKVHDRKAQARLYDYFSKRMFAICMRYASCSAEAEDILQNAFVKVFTKNHLYDGRGSLEGWIKRIVVNTAIENFRNKQGKQTLSLEANEDLQVMSDIGTDRTGYDDLRRLVQRLPLGYRTVFNLYAIEGYSHREIADMLGITENTSKSQLSRARQWLQERLIHQST